jgi:hypothetical protein
MLVILKEMQFFQVIYCPPSTRRRTWTYFQNKKQMRGNQNQTAHGSARSSHLGALFENIMQPLTLVWILMPLTPFLSCLCAPDFMQARAQFQHQKPQNFIKHQVIATSVTVKSIALPCSKRPMKTSD